MSEAAESSREFLSTGRDTARGCIYYLIIAPMLALLLSGAASYGMLELALFLQAGNPVIITFAAIGALIPPLWILVLIIKDVRRRAVDRIVIDRDRVTWTRGIRTFSLPVERLAVLRLHPGICSLLPERGKALHLPIGCWALTEIRPLLKERLTPGLTEQLKSDLAAGRIRRYSVHGRLPALYLSGGLIILSLGLIFGISLLKSQSTSEMGIRFAVAALIFLGGGSELLRRFFQIARHRIMVDRKGITSGGWILKTSIPWDQITMAQENARGMRLTGLPGARPLQIEHEIDHYPVLAALSRFHLQGAPQAEGPPPGI